MPISDLVLPDGRVVPQGCLQASFARGGGPGGQHVNKTSSKVDLRLDLAAAAAVLGDRDVARIRERLATRLDADGRLAVTASEHRSQHQNIDAAMARMVALIAGALRRPKRRIRTRPTAGSKRRRIEAKRQRSALKKDRSRKFDE